MKINVLLFLLLSIAIFANAQPNEDCISIIESNLCSKATTIVKIVDGDNKITVLSEEDGTRYKLLIDLNSFRESRQSFKVGGWLSIQEEDGNRYLYVASKKNQDILIKKFKVCDDNYKYR